MPFYILRFEYHWKDLHISRRKNRRIFSACFCHLSSRPMQFPFNLFGLPSYEIQKLQRVHNTAAHIVTRTRSDSHVTPVLKSLHWLTIETRIRFKVLITVFRQTSERCCTSLYQELAFAHQTNKAFKIFR
jgi:hypothetical protein